jgi:hypothetical protein
MTDRDIMKQALDALTGVLDDDPKVLMASISGGLYEVVQCRDAITALRERLAHCDRCGKRLGEEGDIHTCTPQTKPMTEFDEAVAAVDATLHHAIHLNMTAKRAEFFMRRFKHIEKLFGPNEQAALDYVLAMLAAAPQPEQEPVAYLCENAVGHKYFRWKKPSSTYKPIALYTAPPQRKPLTDEEIGKIAGETLDPWSCARAIEAAHGIKD